MNNRWLIIGLIVSGALNLFLVGTAVGVLALGQRLAQTRPDNAPRPGQEIMRAAAVLPPEEARKLRQALRREAIVVQPQIQASRQARRQAWLDGANADFNAAAVKAALAQARARDIATRARIEDTVVDLAADLTPEQRRAYFRAIARPPPPPGFWGGRRPGRPGMNGPFMGGPGFGPQGPPGARGPGMGPPRFQPQGPPDDAGPPPELDDAPQGPPPVPAAPDPARP